LLTVDYDRLGARSGELVLDMGAGAGRHAFESLRRGTRIIALDYSHEELTSVRDLFWAMGEEGEMGKGGAALAVRGDALRLPFADDTFDRIICAEVLEHIADDAGAIRELTRVLKPGGTIAVTVPSWLPEKLCWWLSAEYHAPLATGGHVRIYTEELLRSRLNDAGLEPGQRHATLGEAERRDLRLVALGDAGDALLDDDVSPLLDIVHHRVGGLDRMTLATQHGAADHLVVAHDHGLTRGRSDVYACVEH